MDCIRASEQLPDLVDGMLSPSERASLLEHLNQCQSCRDELRSLQSVIRMIRALPEVNLPTHFRAQLFERLQREDAMISRTVKKNASSRWYQWSVAAAAVFVLAWSMRFASVKPSFLRPTDVPATTAPAETTTGSGGSPVICSVPETATMVTNGEQEAREQEPRPVGARVVPTDPLPSSTTTENTVKMVAFDGLYPESLSSISVLGVSAPAPAYAASEQPPPSAATVVVTESKPENKIDDGTAESMANPSFTTSRNKMDSDRYREDTGYGAMGLETSAETSADAVTVDLEEYVTRLRVNGPGPDELRQRLRQLTQSEKLTVTESNPTSRVPQFSVRGSEEQIARLASQIGSLAAVTRRETTVVDLKPEWGALQGLIDQTRLEIARREEMLRQTKLQAEIDLQNVELQRARSRLQSHEDALRTLRARVGMAVLEIRY